MRRIETPVIWIAASAPSAPQREIMSNLDWQIKDIGRGREIGRMPTNTPREFMAYMRAIRKYLNDTGAQRVVGMFPAVALSQFANNSFEKCGFGIIPVYSPWVVFPAGTPNKCNGFVQIGYIDTKSIKTPKIYKGRKGR